jgi:uncharacterized membrane protein YvlD (DUF360 family)
MVFLRDLLEDPLRQLEWLLISVVSGMISLWLLDLLLDDFRLDGFTGLVVAALTISLVQAMVWPFVYRLLAPLPALVFPVIIFLASGAIIMAASWLDDVLGIEAFSVDGIETAIWITLGLTLITTLVMTLFSLDDNLAFDKFVTGPLRTKYLSGQPTAVPGFLFLEIDGLAGPVLEQAVQQGYAPNLKRWMDRGSHALTVWEPDLSCQTSASQAGILLGSNENIPAFRWWDKQRGHMMVSSSMSTAKLLEQELSTGAGLLAPHGSSRFNVFSGGAPDCVGTFSKLNPRAGPSSYWAYFANPYTLARTFSLFLQDVVREWWEEFRQNQENVLPRIGRPWKYAFIRAGTTAVQLEIARFMMIADVFKGVPSAYYTLFAYDEVAHHTGISRHYTFKVLAKIDRIIGHLEQVAANAPRPMHLVVLSDHGQSQGATFLQRYEVTLAELVKSLLPGDAQMTSILESNEAAAHFEAMLTEGTQGDNRSAKTALRLLRSRTQDGVVHLGSERAANMMTIDEVVVLASGNLGLISFTRWTERMTIQEISDAFPGLIEGLSVHEGVGLIMVTDHEEGGIVIGKRGVYFLDSDTFEGENPLEPYGALAAHHLRRTNSFAACPDVLVISTYWHETDEVAAFEELVGNHGGLGGTQRKPFVLHPTEFDPGEDLIVGAAELNAKLRSWISEAQVGLEDEIPGERV